MDPNLQKKSKEELLLEVLEKNEKRKLKKGTRKNALNANLAEENKL